MGFRLVEHSDMCGCERCAAAYEHDQPMKVFDRIEDANWCTYCQRPLDACVCAYEDEYDYDDDDDDTED